MSDKFDLVSPSNIKEIKNKFQITPLNVIKFGFFYSPLSKTLILLTLDGFHSGTLREMCSLNQYSSSVK